VPASRLGQTLIIRPEIPFIAIEAGLAELGWTRNPDDGTGAPLMDGEPEFATWTWQGRKPFVIYTFNPVVSMRVLDVATLPPALREAVAAKWPLLDERGIEQLFDAPIAKERLLGLWAAQETERLDLLHQAELLTRDPEPVIADQAREVCGRLRRLDESRHELLANLKILTEAAPMLIKNLSDRSYVRNLAPGQEDLTDLFDENLKPVLLRAVEAIYSQKLRVSPLAPDAVVQAVATPAGLLRWPNLLSDKFPQGYRDIAGWMNPKRIWLCWTITTPTGGTVRYDGLVWLDGRWVWLPKIYRYVAPYLLEKPEFFAHRH
jgi:hypothetical protein